jgi:hypothetical protein
MVGIQGEVQVAVLVEPAKAVEQGIVHVDGGVNLFG